MKKILILFITVFLSKTSVAYVDIATLPGNNLFLQVSESDIENGQDVTATMDFCLYSDISDVSKGDGIFRIRYDSNNGFGTVSSLEDPNFTLPYTIGVAVQPGQSSGFTNLTEGVFSSNDTPLALGYIPPNPCAVEQVPTMTLQMTIPGSALASARAGPYGGPGTLTLTVDFPTL